MKFVLVHGFNVKNGGSSTIDKLVPYILRANHEVDKDEADYGYFNLFMIRLFKKKHRKAMIDRLKKAFEGADVIITHSNGAYFTTLALHQLGHEYGLTKVVVHISPALNSDTPIPIAVKAQLVMHTPHDGWVKLASFLPLHPWGRMGARGYTGASKLNLNVENAKVRRHSNWFNTQHIRNTWSEVINFVREAVL